MLNTKKIVILFLILFLILVQTHFVLAVDDAIYVWSSLKDESVVTNAPVSNNESNNSLNLESGSAILIEQNSGTVLYNHNMHEALRPASVTKIMTILLIMEAIDSGRINYTDKVPCSENASKMGGSQIWLDVSEELTVDEMLKAICVVSANDYKVQLRHKKIEIDINFLFKHVNFFYQFSNIKIF